MRLTRLLILALLSQCLAVSDAALAQATAGASSAPAPEGAEYCFTNLAGLGTCAFSEKCLGLAECDASTPCADGTVCLVGTACPSLLDGVCIQPSAIDHGCSNPGTEATGFEFCTPVLFHEDFTPPVIVAPEGGPPPDLHQLTVTADCGTGGSLFENEACAPTIRASSPRATARWGVALNCATYATAGHRVHASTGPVDISSCDRARLDFDYAILFNESGQYDRAFVTVLTSSPVGPHPELAPAYEPVVATNQGPGSQAFTVEGLSCGGGVLPYGLLIQDGLWHHFSAAIGQGPVVDVKFWSETKDDIANAGAGWFFDDVRIECTDRIFDDGFESVNVLHWSSTTAPPLSLQIEENGTCGTYLDCGGPGSFCYNQQSAEGAAYCMNLSCGADCTTSADCAAGEVCVINDCCGGDNSHCAPKRCDPGAGIF